MKRTTVAELEKVVAELAFENGQLRGQVDRLSEKFDEFIEMDKQWSEKIGGAVTALIKDVDKLHDDAKLSQALMVDLMRKSGVTIEEALEMVSNAKETIAEVDKMTEAEFNAVVEDAKEAMSNVH